MKIYPKVEMEFIDNGDYVKLLLSIDERIYCDYENFDTKPVRVRAPLPAFDKFIERAIYWVERDSNFNTVEEWVNFYIESRNREIFKQVKEIRKSLKRIKSFTDSKAIAMDALHEYRDNKI